MVRIIIIMIILIVIMVLLIAVNTIIIMSVRKQASGLKTSYMEI